MKYISDPSSLALFTKSKHTPSEVMQDEFQLLQILNFRVSIPTTYTFLTLYMDGGLVFQNGEYIHGSQITSYQRTVLFSMILPPLNQK
jgi:hypothetical protein